MEKKAIETFKKYTQHWRDLATQVNPPISNKEMMSTFIGILRPPFYHWMISNALLNFSNIVIIRERIKHGVKISRIVNHRYFFPTFLSLDDQ